MKSINKALTPVLESAIKKSIRKFSEQNSENILSDLYLFFDDEELTLHFYDDMDNELFFVQLENVTEEELKNTARFVLHQLEKEHYFDKDYIFKPFSVSLIDKEFMVLEELIFVDDDTLKLEDNLLVNLNKELDDFFKDLMK